MQNTYMNKMLQRIADAVERGTGGSITIDVTGAGDMQGATARAAGVHGLVPAPAAGDENKVVSGAGTWIDAGSGGAYSLSEEASGRKWIDGKNVYQQSVVAINATSATVILPLTIDTIISIDWVAYDADNNQWITSNVFGNTYMVAVYFDQGGIYIEYRGTNNINVYATIKYTKP